MSPLKHAIFALILTWGAFSQATIANLDTCFAPDENCDQKLIEFVTLSEKTLDVAIYNLTLKPYVQAIVSQLQKGVKVRMVIDHEMAQDKLVQFQELKTAGALIKYGGARGIMHDKFTVLDGQKIETGSFNYTVAATKMNSENQIYLFDEKPVKAFVAEFEDLWTNGIDF